MALKPNASRKAVVEREPFVPCCVCGASASYCFWRQWLCVKCGAGCPTSCPEAETGAYVAERRILNQLPREAMP